jgi:hypothetical protein
MTKALSIALLTVAILVGSLIAKPRTVSYRPLTPASFDRAVDVTISGKNHNYYVLQPGTKVVVEVKGPSKLRIISRAVFDGAGDTVTYTFAGQRKGTRKTTAYKHTTHAAEKVEIAGMTGKHVGLNRIKVVDVPRGNQVYTFTLPKSATTDVLLHFTLDANEFTRGTSVVALTPAEYTTAVDLVSREEMTPYYRIGTGHQVVLKLVGPVTLKVLSRIEFDANMNGKQKWKVRVTEDGKTKGTYSLASRKSELATYRETSALVPSRAETFFVEVPAGEHRYEFTLPENHRTVLLRFLLPKNELVKD